MKTRKSLALLLCVIATAIPLYAQTPKSRTLSAAEAKDHIGEPATVCGSVASTRYAASSRGRPTFLNLDKPYPNHIFTVVIWGQNRAKFGRPEGEYRGKDICVSGKIGSYRGVPQIVASEPSQIKVQPTRGK